MSDWLDYAREVQAAADSAGRRADSEMKSLKCKIQKLEKACREWSKVSQSNYQRAKAAEAKLAVVEKERDEWQSLAEAAVKDDAAKNIHYAEIQTKLATASYNATAFGHRIVALEAKLERISEEWASALYGDLDHGVKSLSEAAHLDFHRRYPSVASFGSTLLDIMLEDNT